jgi:hypothetical protein
VDSLKSLIRIHSDKHLLVVGHHPVRTNGTHGGHIPAKHWIFPFTLANKYLWIPFPVLGIPYGIYRTWIGHPQDLAHKNYKRMAKRLTPVFQSHPNLVYVSGHDHTLQLHDRKGLRQVVSGSGSKKDYVTKGHGADFTYKGKGYATLNYMANGEVQIEYWRSSENFEPEILFRKTLLKGPKHFVD